MFEFLLLIIAFFVFYGLLHKKNMWLLIIAYWAVLTMKNFFGLLEVI